MVFLLKIKLSEYKVHTFHTLNIYVFITNELEHGNKRVHYFYYYYYIILKICH